MSELTKLNISEIRDAYKKNEFTPTELTKQYLKNIDEADKLNAYVLKCHEQALKMAKTSDDNQKNSELRALEGIPLGIKDLFATKNIRTTACSNILSDFIPTYESTVTENLWQDGAVLLGKLNNDEFAMGSSNETSAFGSVINPWRSSDNPNKDLVPGGSSGGSSTAVSARLCAGATATDTGGSIRQPASLTGTVGLKPTYGRCSRWGIVAFASSLDQAGPITRSVRDAAIMLGSMASHDKRDSTSVDIDVPDYEADLDKSIKGFKVGIPKEYRIDGTPQEIIDLWEKGIEWYRDAGAQIVDISLPYSNSALPTYYIVAPAEASSNLARYDGVRYGKRVEADNINEMYEKTRAEGFGKEVKRRIMIGTYVLSAGYYDAYYVKAQKVRKLIADDFSNAFQKVDVILTPTTPNTAFGIGDNIDDPIKMYLNDIFTVPANMAGIPGISVHADISKDGLPMGLQLMAKPFAEAKMLQAAQIIEKCAGLCPSPNKWW